MVALYCMEISRLLFVGDEKVVGDSWTFMAVDTGSLSDEPGAFFFNTGRIDESTGIGYCT